MKKLAVVAAAFLFALPLAAQDDLNAENTPTSVQAHRAAQRKLDAERRVREALEGRTIFVYGGFFVDLTRAESKKSFLSLRKPRDPKSDYQHVYLDPRTDRPKGFVLFSLSF